MNPAERIAEITAALAEARAAASDSMEIDLSGLIDTVEQAMSSARAAPLAEHAALTARMLALLSELDSLTQTLTRLRHANVQARAAAAYAEARGRDGEGR